MATSSRGDKRNAHMVEQEDIGTEEEELLDVHPPLPEPVGRSGSDRKLKKPAREEDGPLAVALLPLTAEEKRVENARKKAEKDENYRQNSIFKHRWFVWFTQETNNQTLLEQRFFTPGSLRGIQNFRSHLMELAVVRFLEEKEKPDARPWETSVSAMFQRLARFLEEVPKNWDKHYDLWLKSREFESWTQDVVRQKGEKPLLIIPGLTMRNDEEKKKWKRTAELWVQWFKSPNSIKDHACTSAKYKARESMSDNTIRFISKNNFTRMDETTRLGVGGAGRLHRVGLVDEELVPVLGAHDVVHYAMKIWHGEKGDTKVHEKCIREMMAFPKSHPAIIRPIGLSKDKKRPTLLFPLWNGCTLEKYINLEKRSRGRISPKGVRCGSIAIFIGRMFFYIFLHGIGTRRSRELTLEETMRTDRYRPSSDVPWRWIAPELNPKLAIDDEDGKKYMTKFSQESDIYDLGWLIREMCGDFFTDMTDEEKHEYN
ncbi:hypothetical protein R1sor_014858 [Riccia sorocarpa]|uniref:Protein kinase domain-containing protein n=1 Tax=Riccia sorocarpa TaxID=122646 RepID=A0ABD3HGR9_9MARC